MTGFGQVLWRLGLKCGRQQVVVDSEPPRSFGRGGRRRTLQLGPKYLELIVLC